MRPNYDPDVEFEKADAVVGKYFGEDVTTADAAYDILVENGVNPQYALHFAEDMYPGT